MNDYNLEKILLTNKSEEMNENSNESMKLYQKDIISRISQLILDERNEQIQIQEESTWNIYFINKGIYIFRVIENEWLDMNTPWINTYLSISIYILSLNTVYWGSLSL